MKLKTTLVLIFAAFAFTELKAQSVSNDEKIDLIWNLGREKIYPKVLAKKFTDDKRIEVKKLVNESGYSIADAINPFLKSLNVSHTHIYDHSQMGYYFLRSLFTTKDISSPKAITIGAQFLMTKNGLYIRSILEGLPAEQAGLKVGDLITHIDQKVAKKASDFFPYVNQTVKIKTLSKGKTKTTIIRPIKESIHESLLQATKNSIQIIKKDNKEIGYIHLWSGTNKLFLEALKSAVLEKFKECDGVILDLRDGYGGAWWDYLDPFFKDRQNYFVATKLSRDGKRQDWNPPAKENLKYFSKPVVVLINSGVRSGKEAVAYQFKKSSRAKLIGTRTSGAFTGGFGGFSDKDIGLIFYLSTFELLLDGTKIEGVGIEPDINVKREPGEIDNQLETAIYELLKEV